TDRHTAYNYTSITQSLYIQTYFTCILDISTRFWVSHTTSTFHKRSHRTTLSLTQKKNWCECTLGCRDRSCTLHCHGQ
ncbi:hypothetical protein NDU88_004460, partial [Pleurodeles waltl]